MSPVEAYGHALIVAIGVALVLGSRGLWLAGAAMLAEWLVCNGAVVASGRLDPAEAFALFHFLCAVLLLRDGRHSAQVIIGGIYAGLFLVDGLYLALHLARDLMLYFGLRWVTGPPSVGLFLWITAGGGWAQIAVLAAGSAANGTRKRSCLATLGLGRVGAGLALAGAAVLAGVAHASGSP